MEPFAVISGKASSGLDGALQTITSIAKERYANYTTAHHEWIDKLPSGDYKTSINSIRYSTDILDEIKKRFPNTAVKNVTQVDEVYWAVSPKTAKGSDRSLVDCHYDAPFGLIPTGGVIYYRVIIAANENDAVTTVFPSESKTVKMNTGDFHGLDYNKDWHCVEGKIPEGKYRVLLKLHYLITPPGSEVYAPYVEGANVAWTVGSRETMRMSADPQNVFEWFIGLLVNVSRFTFNHWIPFSFIILVILGLCFNPKVFGVRLPTFCKYF
jgi:hypothetical protein